MKRTLLVTAVSIAVSLMMAAPAAHADAFTFVADLTQALEVPATGSTATGIAFLALDTVANTMHVDVTFSGLSSGTTASHIHCCGWRELYPCRCLWWARAYFSLVPRQANR